MERLDHTNYERYIRTEAQFVRPVGDFLEGVYALEERGDAHDGEPLPWAKTRDKIRLRESEVTVLAGIGGSGKSAITGQIALDYIARNRRVLIASLEMTPVKTLRRMLQQFAGQERSTPEQRRRFEALKGGYIYEQTGVVHPNRLLGLLHFAGQELFADLVVIDALFMVGLRVKDSDEQSQFLVALSYIAKRYGMHIILVHHLRKGSDPNHLPNSFDLRGASELRDAADNVLLFWKNQAKIDKKEASEPVDPREPDNLLIVDKQRHGPSWTGKIALYYDHPSNGFKETEMLGSRITYA